MEFRILGPLEVLDGERTIEIAGTKQRTVLALLLLRANEVVRSERLVEEVWGERPPSNALAALQSHVSRLRKALGPDVITSRQWGYALRTAPENIDVKVFEQLVADADTLPADDRSQLLAQALALWRGTPLSDLTLEPAVQRSIARLEELHVSTVERRIDADLEAGRDAELIGELEALVAEHPLREHARSQLILALYRSGRQAEALEVYRETRRVLAEELGLDPSPELRELERAILRQDPSLALAPRITSAAEPEPLPLPPASRRRRWLVGGIAGILAVAIGAVALAFVVARAGDTDSPGAPGGLVDTLDRSSKQVTLADAFRGDYVDQTVWSEDRSGSGWDVSEQHGHLEFTFSPRAQPGGVYHQFGGHLGTICTFPGDFDARVAFQLASWPAWNGLYVSLTAFLGPANASWLAARTSQLSGGEQYSSGTGFYSSFPADDRSGALRVVRRHGLVTTYHLKGRHWQKMESARETEPAKMAIGVLGSSAEEFGGQSVVVDFTDFSVSGAATACPTAA